MKNVFKLFACVGLVFSGLVMCSEEGAISRADIAQWSAQVGSDKEADKEDPLYQAIIHGRPEDVEDAIKNGADPSGCFKLTGVSPLVLVAPRLEEQLLGPRLIRLL